MKQEKKAGMLSWILVLPNSDQDGILHKKQNTNWLESRCMKMTNCKYLIPLDSNRGRVLEICKGFF